MPMTTRTPWRERPDHLLWLAQQSARAIASARGACVEGGFGWLGEDGKPDPSRGTPLWITARMTFVFSVGTVLGLPGCRPLVTHGVRALKGPFHDAQHGGWFDRVAPGVATKGAYEHAFVLLAAASATQAGDPEAPRLLEDAARVVEQRFWDDGRGLCLESWDQTWTVPEPYRGANANMHMVEAFQAVSDATGDEVWRHRALRIAERLVDVVAREHGWRLPEHYDEGWRPRPDYNADQPRDAFRPYGITPGHGIEWSRLLVQLHETGAGGGAPWLLPAAASLFDRAVADGWDEVAGGLVYTTDPGGRPVVADRYHWGVAELVSAAAALHAATGEDRYEDWYRTAWDYAATYLVDEATGTWCHELDADNVPAAHTWPGRPDTYHVLQALLLPRLPVRGSVVAALLDAGVAAEARF